MKSRILFIILFSATRSVFIFASAAASQPNFHHDEGVPTPPGGLCSVSQVVHVVPSAPPMSEVMVMPSVPPPAYVPNQAIVLPRVLAGEDEMKRAHVRNICMKALQKIYQDSSIMKEMKRRFPSLSHDDVLPHTREEKRVRMLAKIEDLLAKNFSHMPAQEKTTLAQQYQKEFFAHKMAIHHKDQCKVTMCCCTARHCYKNWREGWAQDAYTRQWSYDEPTCSGCSVQ